MPNKKTKDEEELDPDAVDTAADTAEVEEVTDDEELDGVVAEEFEEDF